MCRIDDGEGFSVSFTQHRKARRQHKCQECNRVIDAGETYRWDKGLYDGYWSTFKTCAHCQVGQKWLSRECGGFVFDCLGEEIKEHIEEYPEIAFSLSRFFVGMRRRWRRFDRTGVMPVMGALPLPSHAR